MDDLSSIWTDDLMKIVHQTLDLDAGEVKFSPSGSARTGVASSAATKSRTLEAESSSMYI